MVNKVPEDEVRISIRCRESTRRMFKELCAKIGKDYEAVLLELIDFYKKKVRWG